MLTHNLTESTLHLHRYSSGEMLKSAFEVFNCDKYYNGGISFQLQKHLSCDF